MNMYQVHLLPRSPQKWVLREPGKGAETIQYQAKVSSSQNVPEVNMSGVKLISRLSEIPENFIKIYVSLMHHISTFICI